MMKRLRVAGWSGRLLSPKARPCCIRQHQRHRENVAGLRPQSTLTAPELDLYEENVVSELNRALPPSPVPGAALKSAKLAALHARLSLPKKLPLQTLSRTLIDSSADPDVNFNNASMAQIGSSLMSYHICEWLLCTYPRLPLAIMFSAMQAYIGPATLLKIGSEWGVETAAAPGMEVDPGLLQFSRLMPGESPQLGASVRPESVHSHPNHTYRRGMSSRIVYDDEFGDLIHKTNPEDPQHVQQAMALFVRALVGSIYLHAGREAMKSFFKAHILSRHLDITKLFEFKHATRDLSRLCAREEFEAPVARILSETGRLSRSPVFVVGIFSGMDKLGEGVGPSLVEARYRAAISALKAWYLYSPIHGGHPSQMPSDVEDTNTGANRKRTEFEPVHIDLGEIV